MWALTKRWQPYKSFKKLKSQLRKALEVVMMRVKLKPFLPNKERRKCILASSKVKNYSRVSQRET